MGIIKRIYKKAYGRNKPWSRFNRIGYISDSSTGFLNNSFMKYLANKNDRNRNRKLKNKKIKK